MGDFIRWLTILHTSLVDTRNGYQQGLKEAGGTGLASLFAERIEVHGQHADAVAAQLKRMGVRTNARGSLTGTLDRAVMKLTSLVTRLDEKFLPQLIAGEQRLLLHYDKAIAACAPENADHAVLVGQRDALRQRIAEMKLQAEMSG